MLSFTVDLREYVPLKQGLRQEFPILNNNAPWLREYVPLKQGLRLIIISPLSFLSETPRVCSIKTRIKTFRGRSYSCQCNPLREYVPLKQGLRQFVFRIYRNADISESMFH